MLNLIINNLRQRREQLALRRSVDPKAIADMAAELRELASRAAQFCPEETGLAPRLKGLQAELIRLEGLVTRPEFCKLSTEQRLELRQGLLQVRSQILITMQQGPSPTDFIQ